MVSFVVPPEPLASLLVVAADPLSSSSLPQPATTPTSRSPANRAEAMEPVRDLTCAPLATSSGPGVWSGQWRHRKDGLLRRRFLVENGPCPFRRSIEIGGGTSPSHRGLAPSSGGQ